MNRQMNRNFCFHLPLNDVTYVSAVSIQPLGTSNIVNNAIYSSIETSLTTTSATTTTIDECGRTIKRKCKWVDSDSKNGGGFKLAKTTYGPIQLE